MTEPLSHARARAWLVDLATAQPGAKVKGIDPKELRDTLRELPLAIRRQGLALSIASCNAASTRKQANQYVLQKLNGWLHVCWGDNPPQAFKADALAQAVIARAEGAHGPIAYLQDMTEALAFLEWGKQLAAPLAKDSALKKSPPTNAEAEADE